MTYGSNAQIMDRWFDVVCGDTDEPLLDSRTSVDATMRSITHYGHFTLVERLLTRSGRLRGFLLNGDVWRGSGGWGPSTSSLQEDVRRLANEKAAEHGLTVVIVPFSALDAAGVVDRHLIEVIDQVDERYETTEHVSHTPPPYRRRRWHESAEEKNRWYYHWRNKGGPTTSWGYRVDGKVVDWNTPGRRWESWREDRPDGWYVPSVDFVLLPDGTKVTYEQPLPVKPVQPFGGETYHWTTTRHFLGESVIRAKMRTYNRRTGNYSRRWVHLLSGFDHNEPHPLYHLSELPSKQARTVAEAYEELKPTVVRIAEADGREVKRQGDIFAVPTDFDTRTLTRMGGVRNPKHVTNRLLGTRHAATETITLPSGVVLARGTLRHVRIDWRPIDHRMVSLGKPWHIIAKNTVPLGR